MNPLLLLAAAAGVYLFRDKLFGSTAAAPAITAAQTAASNAAASGATPAQQATAAAQAAARVLPTIQVDNASVHNALTAMATADSAASLSRAQAGYGLTDSAYLLTVSQWNWYHTASGLTGGTISEVTEVGDDAIPASRYLALRQARGLI